MLALVDVVGNPRGTLGLNLPASRIDIRDDDCNFSMFEMINSFDVLVNDSDLINNFANSNVDLIVCNCLLSNAASFKVSTFATINCELELVAQPYKTQSLATGICGELGLRPIRVRIVLPLCVVSCFVLTDAASLILLVADRCACFVGVGVDSLASSGASARFIWFQRCHKCCVVRFRLCLRWCRLLGCVGGMLVFPLCSFGGGVAAVSVFVPCFLRVRYSALICVRFAALLFVLLFLSLFSRPFVFQSVFPSVSRSSCPSVSLSVGPSLFLPVSLSMCWSLCLCVFVCLSFSAGSLVPPPLPGRACWAGCPCPCPCPCLSVCLSVRLSVHLSVLLS